LTIISTKVKGRLVQVNVNEVAI